MAIAILLITVAVLSLVWYYFGDNISGVFSKNTDPRDRAIQIAYKEFKKLGENDLDKEQFEVININKSGDESYYVSSKENSVHISKENFEVIRINGKRIGQ